jgi:omega-amidase
MYLKVSIIQADLLWENKSGNLKKLEALIMPLFNKTDLVILPEMFNTGFSMNASLGESMQGETVQWMKAVSSRGNFGICGSLIIKEGKNYFNRFVFLSPENPIHYYDKRHLFGMGGEDTTFKPGNSKLIFTFRGMRISPFICYDLRFPVWSRNHDNYDLAVYTASWPESRMNVWNTLLRARAIENQCYVAGCNRIGTDDMGINYNGLSQIISPRGELICTAGTDMECALTENLSLQELIDFRIKFNVFGDADEFELKL